MIVNTILVVIWAGCVGLWTDTVWEALAIGGGGAYLITQACIAMGTP